jgi:hypothetical protein
MDFTPAEEVPQGTMDAGIYAHQVRLTPTAAMWCW